MIGKTIHELQVGDVAERVHQVVPDDVSVYISRPPLIDSSAPVM